ncbi:MAG: hypothetical protein LBJ67_02895 [Planctomycetaceae bacterium]|jgi:hypothetical protein|nr:hypothetical protein [Planctomycetaceae bacterium]
MPFPTDTDDYEKFMVPESMLDEGVIKAMHKRNKKDAIFFRNIFLAIVIPLCIIAILAALFQ